jgi:hypothetical protein
MRKRSRQPSAETVNRRRFVRGVGAAGLGAAAATFGGAARAEASGFYKCCYVAFSPPNISMTACLFDCFHLWSCTWGTQSCQCCDRSVSCSNPTTYNGSAVVCVI